MEDEAKCCEMNVRRESSPGMRNAEKLPVQQMHIRVQAADFQLRGRFLGLRDP